MVFCFCLLIPSICRLSGVKIILRRTLRDGGLLVVVSSGIDVYFIMGSWVWKKSRMKKDISLSFI